MLYKLKNGFEVSKANTPAAENDKEIDGRDHTENNSGLSDVYEYVIQ